MENAKHFLKSLKFCETIPLWVHCMALHHISLFHHLSMHSLWKHTLVSIQFSHSFTPKSSKYSLPFPHFHMHIHTHTSPSLTQTCTLHGLSHPLHHYPSFSPPCLSYESLCTYTLSIFLSTISKLQFHSTCSQNAWEFSILTMIYLCKLESSSIKVPLFILVINRMRWRKEKKKKKTGSQRFYTRVSPSFFKASPHEKFSSHSPIFSLKFSSFYTL